MSIRRSNGVIKDSCPYIDGTLKEAKNFLLQMEFDLETVREINQALRGENVELKEEKEKFEKEIRTLQDRIEDLEQELKQRL